MVCAVLPHCNIQHIRTLHKRRRRRLQPVGATVGSRLCQHCLDDYGNNLRAYDDARIGILLRRHGEGKECDKHHAAKLHCDGRGERSVGSVWILVGIWRRYRRSDWQSAAILYDEQRRVRQYGWRRR